LSCRIIHEDEDRLNRVCVVIVLLKSSIFFYKVVAATQLPSCGIEVLFVFVCVGGCVWCIFECLFGFRFVCVIRICFALVQDVKSFGCLCVM
jgi:hypothetical protein